MWNGRDVGLRNQASILSQIRNISRGNRLSEFEKREIECKINKDLCGNDDTSSISEDEVDFVVKESECQDDIVGSADRSVESLMNIGFDDSNAEFHPKVVIRKLDTFVKGTEIRVVNEEERIILQRLRNIFDSPETVVIPSLKNKDKLSVEKEVSLVNGLLHNIEIDDVNVSSVNKLLYAGSLVVCERLGVVKSKKNDTQNTKPWWQRRLESSILRWRKDLSRINELRKGIKLKEKVMRDLEKKYKLLERGWRSVTTFLENKVRSASTKIQNFIKHKETYRQNRLFSTNQKTLYKQFSGKKIDSSEEPNKDEVKQFWSDIWSKEGNFNDEANWVGDFQKYVEELEVEQMEDITISSEDVITRIRKMANWKAPGPDGIQGFWFKKLLSVHCYLVEALGKCLSSGEVPEWMVKGRTVLIQKDPSKGSVASNYRPITCLPLMWKLLTGILACKLYTHLENNSLLPEEQKGCRKGSKGTKDQLLIDKAVLRDAKRRHRFLSMAWIDYRKVYDLVPHSWLLAILEHTKVAGNLGLLIKKSMDNWRTELMFNGQPLCQIDINRGLFQGDSLSPILFVLAMIPLSFLLKREKYGYKMNNHGIVINHLFFMDDLKLYGKTDAELNSLLDIVHNFSQDIDMKFGFDKCASLSIEAGKRKTSTGIS